MKLNSLYAGAIRVLPEKSEKKLLTLVLVQIVLGFLDLLGVAALGFLGALIVNGVQSKEPGDRIGNVLELLNLENNSFQSQAAIIGSIAALILITKTLLSVILVRRTLRYLSFLAARVSKGLAGKLLQSNILFLQKRSPHETYYLITYGVQSLITGVLGTSISLIADTTLSLVIIVGLAVVNPLLAAIVVIFFGGLAFIIFVRTQKRASQLGSADANLSIQGEDAIKEAISSYREIYVMDRRANYLNRYSKFRDASATVQSELALMPQISKYIIETSIVISGLFIAATAFILQDAVHAIATLSVFLAGGTRIAPAVLRIQQGAIHIKSSLGTAQMTLDLASELETIELSNSHAVSNHEDFFPRVNLRNIQFNYPENRTLAISDISLEVDQGDVVALVGPSGAGKTTLVDLILGVLAPTSGQVTISGVLPQAAVQIWPGKIAYVPQETVIANTTIKSNIALGIDEKEISKEKVLRAIEISHLSNFIASLPEGIETHVGENGAKLSGGQRQRIGIARALYSDPQLIVLDEATSSLDGETESNISDAINDLRGEVTLIIVAHRLSTIRAADEIHYLEQGKVVASGKFEELRLKVKDFDTQAKLMGL